MSTTPLSIAETLKYAQLQMAAEAFLVPKTGGDPLTGDQLITALTEGNHHASKFPTKEAAADFLKQWEIVVHDVRSVQ